MEHNTNLRNSLDNVPDLVFYIALLVVIILVLFALTRTAGLLRRGGRGGRGGDGEDR